MKCAYASKGKRMRTGMPAAGPGRLVCVSLPHSRTSRWRSRRRNGDDAAPTGKSTPGTAGDARAGWDVDVAGDGGEEEDVDAAALAGVAMSSRAVVEARPQSEREREREREVERERERERGREKSRERSRDRRGLAEALQRRFL